MKKALSLTLVLIMVAAMLAPSVCAYPMTEMFPPTLFFEDKYAFTDAQVAEIYVNGNTSPYKQYFEGYDDQEGNIYFEIWLKTCTLTPDSALVGVDGTLRDYDFLEAVLGDFINVRSPYLAFQYYENYEESGAPIIMMIFIGEGEYIGRINMGWLGAKLYAGLRYAIDDQGRNDDYMISLLPIIGLPVLVPGDCDWDMNVNLIDMIWMKRYLSGASLRIYKMSADINGDSRINALDLLLLRKLVAAA